jgi:predicted nucleic acid-binding protein
MGAVVLDSSVLIAFVNEKDALHDAAIATLGSWTGDTRRLLTASAYSEMLVLPLRRGDPEKWDGFLEDLAFEIVPIDIVIARAAASARSQRKSLRLPDALVVATALVHGAELVTLDRRMADAHRALAAAR